MKREGRILVLDDEGDWRDIFSRVLRGASFHVDTAESSSEAFALLTEKPYHLAVLDISMVYGDRTNTEGMQLLRQLIEEDHLGAMEVLIISGYGTPDLMRAAFKEYKVADFQDKLKFNRVEFVEQVRQILAASLNLDLEIYWEQADQPLKLVNNLDIAGERVKRESPQVVRLTQELDELLCRLFQKAVSVLVKPFASGTSGSVVLNVRPFYQNGGGQPVVVKFGDHQRINREHENFKSFAQPYIGGRRNTTVIDVARTVHLGGIVYSLLGSTGDELETFANYYSRVDVPQIKQTLTKLFAETCGAWYASQGNLQLRNLTEEYQRLLGFTEGSLIEALAQVKSVEGKQKLHFVTLEEDLGTLTNPILAVSQHMFIEPTYACITHGDMNGSNILVDRSEHAWLIDFEFTGQGHILRDIAELDTVIRFQLLKPDEASLAERLKLEEALCKPRRFSDVATLDSSFETTNAALAKAYETCVILRRIAQGIVAHNPSDDIKEYYVALLYYSLNSLRFRRWRTVQRQHALLSASLLTDRTLA